MRPGVPTCESEPTTDDKAGGSYEHPSPRRPPWPVGSLARGWVSRVITRWVGGSERHIETVGPVPGLDKVRLDPHRMCLISPVTPGDCRRVTALSILAPMWLG